MSGFNTNIDSCSTAPNKKDVLSDNHSSKLRQSFLRAEQAGRAVLVELLAADTLVVGYKH